MYVCVEKDSTLIANLVKDLWDIYRDCYKLDKNELQYIPTTQATLFYHSALLCGY